jgi:Leucine-rich repeat (LRR) protein
MPSEESEVEHSANLPTEDIGHRVADSSVTVDTPADAEVLSQQLFEDFLCYQAMVNANESYSPTSDPVAYKPSVLSSPPHAPIVQEKVVEGGHTTEEPEDVKKMDSKYSSYSCEKQVEDVKMSSNVFKPDQSTFELRDCTIYTLPLDWIHSSKSLSKLTLINTQLESLPEAIAEMTHLSCLCISHNNLTYLPESFSKLHNLTFLDLSSNRITRLGEFHVILYTKNAS